MKFAWYSKQDMFEQNYSRLCPYILEIYVLIYSPAMVSMSNSQLQLKETRMQLMMTFSKVISSREFLVTAAYQRPRYFARSILPDAMYLLYHGSYVVSGKIAESAAKISLATLKFSIE